MSHAPILRLNLNYMGLNLNHVAFKLGQT